MNTDFEPLPFADLPNIEEPLRRALEQRGFKDLTSIQRAVLNAEAEGRNLRISSQTGSGKTVALGFALAPMLIASDKSKSETNALIITPTRELAIQVKTELDWLFGHIQGITVDVVTGGTDLRTEKRRLQKAPRVLVATPGRLLDHMRSGAVKVSAVREVVLDEADQMLDMGFRDDLDAIVDALPAERRSHLVSATFPVNVKRLAERFQQNALLLQGTALGAANQDIEHIAHLIYEEDRYKALVNVLLSHLGERALVFVRKRTDAAEVAEELANEGFAALPLSGDMAQAQRQRALAAFKSGTVQILIATDVAARGIHVDDIAVVIHSDIPTDSEIYTHRSGRTGRAGNKGSSVLLVPVKGERRAQRLLRDANVKATFAPLPTPKKILQRLVKDARRKLHELLTQERELPQAEYAAQLLAAHPPERLVATLLEMAQAPLPREPFDLAPPPPPREMRPAGAGIGFTRFSVSWGAKGGANVNRLLSHVCRRSGLSREAFGAIDVGGITSFVDVRNDLVAEFEAQVQKPDDRDPNVRIKRDAVEGGTQRSRSERPTFPPRYPRPRQYGAADQGDRPQRKVFGGNKTVRDGERPERRPVRDDAGHAHQGPKRDHSAAATRKRLVRPEH